MLNKEGGDRLHALTDANLKRKLAIVLQGEVLTAPNIASAVRTRVVIGGAFSKQEVERMVAVLKAAAKPG